MATSKFLSIIIPLYNEEKRLFNLKNIYRFLKNKKFNWEIILVDDGSVDKTLKIIKQMIKINKYRNTQIISYSQNRGKGYAVKSGMLKARGDYQLFLDIDLSTPIEEFDKFLPLLEKFDIIIGSRRKSGARVIIRQPRIREKLGKGFTKLSQIVLQLKTTDFTCGFKCFSRTSANKIFTCQKISSWSFDSEILFLAKKFRYNVKEVPVKWSNDPKSRVKFPQDIVNSLIDLLTIRLNDFKKIY